MVIEEWSATEVLPGHGLLPHLLGSLGLKGRRRMVDMNSESRVHAPVLPEKMKGIIFNLLEDVVIRNHGEDTWDELLAAAALDGAYTSLGSYPDEQIHGLVAAASHKLSLTPFEILRWFGQQAIPLLFERYPAFFNSHFCTRAFVLSVNNIIHPEVRKIYPGADVPTFEFRHAPDGGLLMGYLSPRRLCALAQGFIEGAATHYRDTVILEHRECMHKGDKRCLCHISFASDRSH